MVGPKYVAVISVCPRNFALRPRYFWLYEIIQYDVGWFFVGAMFVPRFVKIGQIVPKFKW
jgi:hypothetical protein